MSDSPQILVLEGPLSRDMAEALASQGWQVRRVSCPEHLLQEAREADLLVLDTEAPEMIVDVYQWLQSQINAPLLLIAPQAGPNFSVQILRTPFGETDLVQQIQAILERPRPAVVQVGELMIDLKSHRVILRGERVRLSLTQFRLLASLARRLGDSVSYAELLQEVWDAPPDTGDRSVVTTTMQRLRRKLGEQAHQPEYLMNEPGMGYRLRDQAQWEAAMRRTRLSL